MRHKSRWLRNQHISFPASCGQMHFGIGYFNRLSTERTEHRDLMCAGIEGNVTGEWNVAMSERHMRHSDAILLFILYPASAMRRTWLAVMALALVLASGSLNCGKWIVPKLLNCYENRRYLLFVVVYVHKVGVICQLLRFYLFFTSLDIINVFKTFTIK